MAGSWLPCNDTLQSYEGTLQVGEETLTGDGKWDKTIKVVDSRQIHRPSWPKSKQRNSAVPAMRSCLVELNCGDEQRSDVFFPNFWKDADWPEPKLEICSIHEVAEGVVDVTIKAEQFARCVHFEGINEGCADGVPVIVEDAFFDLRAGESRTIRLKSAAPIATDDLRLQPLADGVGRHLR